MAERSERDEYGLDEQLLRQMQQGPMDESMPGGGMARTADFRDRDGDGTDDRDQPAAGGPKMDGPAPSGPRSYDYIPGAESVKSGSVGKMSGFNTAGWGGGQEGYDEFSYKNTFGKLASNYESTPDSVRALVNTPEFKAQFPNARLVDHPTDPKIQFEPNDAPVDVLASSGQGGWQWLPEDGGGGAGVMAGMGGGGGVDDLMNADLSGIMAQAQALTDGSEIDPTLLQQILGQEMV
jgi:hypothetical protein